MLSQRQDPRRMYLFKRAGVALLCLLLTGSYATPAFQISLFTAQMRVAWNLGSVRLLLVLQKVKRE